MFDRRETAPTTGESFPRAVAFHRAMAHGAASAKTSVPDARPVHRAAGMNVARSSMTRRLDGSDSRWIIPRPGEGILADLTASHGSRDV